MTGKTCRAGKFAEEQKRPGGKLGALVLSSIYGALKCFLEP